MAATRGFQAGFQKSSAGQSSCKLYEHPSSMDSNSIEVLKCPVCSYITHTKSRLRRHKLRHFQTVDEKLFGCIHCNGKFKSFRSLDDHIIKKHPQQISSVTSKIFKCLVCPYKTTIKDSLNRHISSAHPETRMQTATSKLRFRRA
ncbi:unnamed protein product [Acanthoscelides obtectus]|uniref:C2H2-type domain-containing protein n=1 Tax=Acanthoscelides obtectus TaxID=200917 RepID=A0A9P0PEM0_ACAOB|nr:unnamed protein product [Acanthoscelides obtectus]CAK1675766.1 hypothetical protein AOBTE_LOCUS30420 [Acanthoscelides obtectus]